MAKTTEESTLKILVPALKRGRNLLSPQKTTTPGSVHSTPAGRASHKGTAYHDKNFPSYQGVGCNCSINPPLPWLKFPFKCHAYLQQRSTLSAKPLSLEMCVRLGSIEYVDPPNATLISVVAPTDCR